MGNPPTSLLDGSLQVLQNVRCMRSHPRIVGTVVCKARLDEHLLNHTVVDDGCVSPRALAKAPLRSPAAVETHGPSKRTGAVGDELDLLEVSRIQRIGCVGLLFLQAVRQTPLSHHEGIVHTQTVDLINSERFDLILKNKILFEKNLVTSVPNLSVIPYAASNSGR